jgi:hypothetical protein
MSLDDVNKLCENVFVSALNKKIVPPQISNLAQTIYIIKKWILKVVNLENGTENKKLKKFVPVISDTDVF